MKTLGNTMIKTAIRQLTKNVVNNAYYDNNKTTYEQAYERQQARKEALYMASVISNNFQYDFSLSILCGKKEEEVEYNKEILINPDKLSFVLDRVKYLVIPNEHFLYTINFCNEKYTKGNAENSFLIPIDRKIRDRRNKSGYRIDTDLEEYKLVPEDFIKEKILEKKDLIAKKEEEEKEEKKIIFSCCLFTLVVVMFILSLFIFL